MEKIIIGIDCGVNTGVAVWNSSNRVFESVESMKIHRAFKIVETYSRGLYGPYLSVRFEDARLRKWFGNSGREVLQGVGSVKRDCSIWEDWLRDHYIMYEAVKPKKGMTKWKSNYFKQVTGWTGRTNEHSRDAAVLVFGL